MSSIALQRTFRMKSPGLCLDTGHMDYSGMDPIATLRRYATRTDYIHFKDIDAREIHRCHGAPHPVLRRLR